MKPLRQHKTKIISVVTLLFILLIGHHVVANWSEFSGIRIVEPSYLIFLTIGIVVNLYATGAMMDTLLDLFNLHIKRKESFGLASITRFSNQIMPGKLGFLLRASYLKNKYRFTLTSSISTVSIAHLLMYMVSSLLGLLAILLLVFSGIAIPAIFTLSLLVLFLTMVGILFMPKMKLPFINRWAWGANRLEDFNKGWSKIKQSPLTLRSILFWALINILSIAVIAFSSFNALGANINFIEAIFISSITILNSILGITPAGIGISEGLTVVAGVALGIPVSISLAAALLKRMFIFTICLLLAPWFSKQLFHRSLVSLIRQSTNTGSKN